MFAGYDMQFDIKYAYFNFLQSVPYQPTHNPTLPGTMSDDLNSDSDSDSDSDCDSFAYGFKNKLGADESVGNLPNASAKEE